MPADMGGKLSNFAVITNIQSANNFRSHKRNQQRFTPSYLCGEPTCMNVDVKASDTECHFHGLTLCISFQLFKIRCRYQIALNLFRVTSHNQKYIVPM